MADSSGVGATQKALDHLGAIPGRSVAVEGPFNFSRAVNLGAHSAECEFLLFLNDDTEIVEADHADGRAGPTARRRGRRRKAALRRRVSAARRRERGSRRGRRLAHLPGDAPTRLALTENCSFPRDCAAVTGVCMLVDRALFERLDGFDDAFPLDLGDTDLCLAYVAWGDGCSSPRTQR